MEPESHIDRARSYQDEHLGQGAHQADELEQSLGAEALDRYGALNKAMRKLIGRQDRMGRPLRVAKVVERALFAPNPRARYLVGPDAKAGGVFARVLPDRAKDALFRRLTGLRVPKQDRDN